MFKETVTWNLKKPHLSYLPYTSKMSVSIPHKLLRYTKKTLWILVKYIYICVCVCIYIYLILTTTLRLKRQGSSHLHRTEHGISPSLLIGLEGLAVVSLSGIWPKHSWLQPLSYFLRAASGAGFGGSCCCRGLRWHSDWEDTGLSLSSGTYFFPFVLLPLIFLIYWTCFR